MSLWDGIGDAEILRRQEKNRREAEERLQKEKQECELLEAMYSATAVINFALQRTPQDAAVGCVLCLKEQEPSFWGRHVGAMTNGGAIWFAVELALDVVREKVPGKSAVIFTCFSGSIHNLAGDRRLWIHRDKADVMLRVRGKLGGAQLVFRHKVNDEERYRLAHRCAKKSLVELPLWSPDSSEIPVVLGLAVEAMTKASPMETKLLEALVEFFPEPCVYLEQHPARRGPKGLLVPQLPVTAGRRYSADWECSVENHYFLDFAILAGRTKLCVEVDGAENHTSPEDKAKDAERERNLRSEGWRVLRFKGSEVFRDAAACARRVLAELR